MAAPADAVWSALLEVVDGLFSSPVARTYARAVGCDPPTGFRVASSHPPHELALEGRHRFSTYTLTFRVDGARVSAASRATFPGVAGAAYRAAVIGTGFHRVAVRRLLRSVARRAEERQ